MKKFLARLKKLAISGILVKDKGRFKLEAKHRGKLLRKMNKGEDQPKRTLKTLPTMKATTMSKSRTKSQKEQGKEGVKAEKKQRMRRISKKSTEKSSAIKTQEKGSAKKKSEKGMRKGKRTSTSEKVKVRGVGAKKVMSKKKMIVKKRELIKKRNMRSSKARGSASKPVSGGKGDMSSARKSMRESEGEGKTMKRLRGKISSRKEGMKGVEIRPKKKEGIK